MKTSTHGVAKDQWDHNHHHNRTNDVKILVITTHDHDLSKEQARKDPRRKLKADMLSHVRGRLFALGCETSRNPKEWSNQHKSHEIALVWDQYYSLLQRLEHDNMRNSTIPSRHSRLLHCRRGDMRFAIAVSAIAVCQTMYIYLFL